MKNKPLKFRLVMQVTIKPDGETPLEIQHRLEQFAKSGFSNGTLTGDSASVVQKHDYYVEPVKSKRSRSFSIINDHDGNDTFEVKAKDGNDAAHEGLKELGWWVAKNDDEDEQTRRDEKHGLYGGKEDVAN